MATFKALHALVLGSLVSLCLCTATVADPTPLSSDVDGGMVFIKAKTSIDGRAFPSVKGEQQVYTLADRRRIDNKFKGDRFYSRWLQANDTQVARLDRKLMWDINHRKKIYRECDITGCKVENLAEEEEEEENEEYQSLEERECSVTPSLFDFKVTPTGKTRTIGGLAAEQFVVEWTLEFKDPAGNLDRNILKFDFWTAPPDERMARAWSIHGQFQEALYTQWSDDPLLRLLGGDGYRAVAAFTGDVKQRDPQGYAGITRDLAQIKGYPISIKFEWYQKSGACPDKTRRSANNEESSGDAVEDLKRSAVGVVTGLFKKVQRNVEEKWKSQPLVRYLYDVESVEYVIADNSQFELPIGYKIEDRQ